MTVSSTTSRVSYAGNGSTTAFPFSYYFHAKADLVVISRVNLTGVETTLVLDTDYTISGTLSNGVYANGGTINATVAPATGVSLIVYRDPSETQGLDLVENDNLPAESLEQSLDRTVFLIQRLKDRVDRAVRLTDGFSATFDPTLPALLTADCTIVINPTGDGLALGPTVANILAATAAAAASAAAAALSASNASTSETNAANSATASANSAAAAATSATNAATSETNAANSATAAATSATAAATSATAAAASATAAATSATNAATSETNAANSATAAATSATNAANSATAAATSATAAATSATNAANSATSAATSATNAANSATAAAASAAAAAASAGSFFPLFDITVHATHPAASFTTRSAALAAVTNGQRIFVYSDANSAAQAATDTLSANDVEVVHRNGLTYTNSGAGTSLSVTGDRNKIVGGRFSGFTVGINLAAGADDNMVHEAKFTGCTTDISDAGLLSDIDENISE